MVQKLLFGQMVETHSYCPIAIGKSRYHKSSKVSATIFSKFSLFGETIFWGVFKAKVTRQKDYTLNKRPWWKGSKYDIKLKNYPLYLTLHGIRTQLKLGATMFWGHLISEDLQYLKLSTYPLLWWWWWWWWRLRRSLWPWPDDCKGMTTCPSGLHSWPSLQYCYMMVCQGP